MTLVLPTWRGDRSPFRSRPAGHCSGRGSGSPGLGLGMRCGGGVGAGEGAEGVVERKRYFGLRAPETVPEDLHLGP